VRRASLEHRDGAGGQRRVAQGKMNARVWLGREDLGGSAMQPHRWSPVVPPFDLDVPPPDTASTRKALECLVHGLFRR